MSKNVALTELPSAPKRERRSGVTLQMLRGRGRDGSSSHDSSRPPHGSQLERSRSAAVDTWWHADSLAVSR